MLNAILLAFVVTNMLAMGMSLGLRQIVAPLRDIRLVMRVLLANIVLTPMIAYAISLLPGVKPSLGISLLLLATAAGSPTLPKLAELARGNLAMAVSTTVLLMAVTVVSMPLLLAFTLPGVSVDMPAIAGMLVAYTLLPLLAGLVLHAWRETATAYLAPIFNRISTVCLVSAMILTPIIHFQVMKELFLGGDVLAGLLFIVLATGLGWLLGGANREVRTVLCLGTAQRNIAAAVVVGIQNFSDPGILGTVILGTVILITVASWAIIVPAACVFARGTGTSPIAGDGPMTTTEAGRE